jgi:L-threonylcarbamoyladenylate synthase
VQTILTTSPDEAAEVIKQGGLVAFPTETVYGLGANIFNENAIARIFEAKGRPADNPLIAHISDLGQIGLLASEITRSAKLLIEAFFPGPLTVVLRKAEAVPMAATAGLDTIGVRMPALNLANQFLKACATPIAAPSANLSGRPSPTTWQAVKEDLFGAIDCILQGEPAQIGLESTVVDCTGDEPTILRTGSVTEDEIRSVVPGAALFSGETDSLARSPGMRHQHYSPAAIVKVTTAHADSNADARSAYIGLQASSAHHEIVLINKNITEYAHNLFEFFRECDRNRVEVIFCESVEDDGIGTALMDRILRAADDQDAR